MSINLFVDFGSLSRKTIHHGQKKGKYQIFTEGKEKDGGTLGQSPGLGFSVRLKTGKNGRKLAVKMLLIVLSSWS